MRVGGRKILPKLEENESAAKSWAQTTRRVFFELLAKLVHLTNQDFLVLSSASVSPALRYDYFDKQGVRHSFIFSAVGHKLKKKKKTKTFPFVSPHQAGPLRALGGRESCRTKVAL